MTMSELRSSSMGALLLLAIIVCPSSQNEEIVEVLEVIEGAPLMVRCELPVNTTALWSRDGAPLGDTGWTRTEQRVGERLWAELRAKTVNRTQSGRYKCRPPPAPAIVVRVLTDNGTSRVVWYEVNHPLVLNCKALRAVNPAVMLQWYKNNTEVSKLLQVSGRTIVPQDNGTLLKFTPHALEDDFGNYTCRTVDGVQMQLSVKGRPHVKLPATSNVVEGQQLKLECRVIGKPSPRVKWSYRKETSEKSKKLETGGRLQLQDSNRGVGDGELVLNPAERTDAGYYTCRAGDSSSTTFVRVKDKYAALWPFLGICAEVFILCVIILVYERRRTKPELEDSGADQDQKNL